MDRYKSAGITVINMMIGGIDDVIWGKSNADAQIEDVIKSIRAAGKVGLAGRRVQLLRESADRRL